ncbi:MAG: TRAP transporter large permease subunit [Spirochaetaceae bacterium]|nr:TRAP transporter large permease subunit [Spirochaetaceae bacterium]
MTTQVLLLLFMIAAFVALVLFAKLPVSLSLVATAMALPLLAGRGLPLDQLVEGMFGYLDTGLVLVTAMIFLKVIEGNGLLGDLTRGITIRFGKSPLVLLVALTVVIMFPGMITGSCTASVLGTGTLVSPILLAMGMPLPVVGAVISSAAVYGMIAPPVNIPVMIIGGGIDLPYIGFDGLLALVTFPMAILTTLFLGLRHVDRKALARVIDEKKAEPRAGKLSIYLPLLTCVILMVGPKAFPKWFPDPRLPLTFLISAAVGLAVGKRFNVAKAARDGVREILPVVGILFGVGMLIEMMTLTGIRGTIVIGALSIPPAFMLLGIALILPLFGGISVYGGASVLGVPFALALLGQNQIVVLSALSLIGAMGSYMPPVALTPVVAAQLIGEPKYGRIIKLALAPAVVAVLVGVAMLVWANPIAKFLGV